MTTRKKKQDPELALARVAMQGADCVCFTVRKAARQISQRYDKALQPHGINANQFSILARLATAGEAGLGETARALGMERTTLTRNLHVLERHGMVDQRPDPADARARRLVLLPKGAAVLRQALPAWQAVQAQTLKKLPGLSWQQVQTALQALGQSA